MRDDIQRVEGDESEGWGAVDQTELNSQAGRRPIVEQDTPATTKGSEGHRFRRLSEAPKTGIPWLWEPRIQLGALTLLEGDPGSGKSLISLELIARITSGDPMPETSDVTSGGAVVVAGEDSEEVIRARIEAAEGDTDRVLVLRVSELAKLEEACRFIDARLVVLDTLFDTLPGDVDFGRDPEVRRFLRRYVKLASEQRLAVIGIRHFTKDDSRRSSYRGQGSAAFSAVSRSVLAVVKDPDERDGRLLTHVKTNYGQPAQSLRFRVASTTDETGYIEWTGISDYSTDDARIVQAEEAYTPPSRVAEAEQFLRVELSEGAVPAVMVNEAAKELGISASTLKRARERIGVVSRKYGGRRGEQRWELDLPPVEDDHPPTS